MVDCLNYFVVPSILTYPTSPFPRLFFFFFFIINIKNYRWSIQRILIPCFTLLSIILRDEEGNARTMQTSNILAIVDTLNRRLWTLNGTFVEIKVRIFQLKQTAHSIPSHRYRIMLDARYICRSVLQSVIIDRQNLLTESSLVGPLSVA